MKKAIKKLTLIFLAVAAAAFGCAFGACSKSGNDGKAGKWDEYDGVKIAFADEETYNAGEIVESKVLPELSCKLGETRYMIADFDIVSPIDNDGRETVTASVKIQPASAVKATIQETNTSVTETKTADDITEIKATYKIPEKANAVRNMRLIIQLTAVEGSEVYLDTSFTGNSGITAVKTEKISQTAIFEFTPVSEFTYEGNTITGIGDKSVKEIIIPKMVDRNYFPYKIGDYAFRDNGELVSINIPDCVDISEGAFIGCENLERATIAGSVGYSAFSGCSGLKSLTLDGQGSIDAYAFSGCRGLTGVKINGYFIKKYAFAGCSELKSITIGCYVEMENVAYGFGSFVYCSALENITVEEGNTSFKSENNCLLTIDGATLLLGCKNSVIPDSVTDIGVNAFQGCSGLTSIVIPDNVKSIGYGAFEDCGGLESVLIPNGVTSIGDYAFRGCASLKFLNFNGTWEQWQAISKGKDINKFTVRYV